jgi:hypothetical protein
MFYPFVSGILDCGNASKWLFHRFKPHHSAGIVPAIRECDAKWWSKNIEVERIST